MTLFQLIGIGFTENVCDRLQESNDEQEVDDVNVGNIGLAARPEHLAHLLLPLFPAFCFYFWKILPCSFSIYIVACFTLLLLTTLKVCAALSLLYYSFSPLGPCLFVHRFSISSFTLDAVFAFAFVAASARPLSSLSLVYLGGKDRS